MDENPMIIANLFQNTISIFKDSENKELITNDDYYKLKVINLENL